MARVRAIARGFYGNRLREEDEVFDVSEKDAERGATWFVPLSKIKNIAPAEVVKRPESEDEAYKLTNTQLQKFLAEEGIKFTDSDKKKDLVALLLKGNSDEGTEGTEGLV